MANNARAPVRGPRGLVPLALCAVALCAAFAGSASAEGRWAKHYRERVEAFRAENETLPAKRQYVVFVGDSITEGFPLKRHLGDLPALNRGIIADRIGLHRDAGVVHRLPESVYDTHPAVVLLLIGVNDLAASPKPAESWIEGIATIVKRIRARRPKAKLILQTLLPVGRRYARHEEITPKITQLNAAIHALAKKSRKVELLDLHKLYRDRDGYLPDELTGDGLHLKPQAYERWARAVLALPGLPAPLPPAKLKRGDRGNDVLELQRALTGLGYSVGTVDGIFGGDTESALKAFQRDHKLAPDGELRADTTEALARALKRGKPERDATSAEPARLRDGGDEIGVELKGGGPIRAVRHKDAILAFQYRAKMAICADGATNVTRDKSQADADPALLHDPWYQPRTAMNFAGEPVDADSVPYIVLPPPVYKATGAQKGDLCEVVYRGRRRYAIYAEVGPKTKIGEASMFLARELGIDDDPRRGGISAQEVTYTVLVGSGRPRGIRNGGPAVTDKDIQRLGAEAFAQARRQGLLE